MHNIAQALCQQAQQALQPHTASGYRVNHAYALVHLPCLIVAWLRANPAVIDQTVRSIVALLARTREKLRPGRSFPRNHSVRSAQRPRRAYR